MIPNQPSSPRCPFDNTEPCYQITAQGCRNPCGVIRDKVQTAHNGERHEKE